MCVCVQMRKAFFDTLDLVLYCHSSVFHKAFRDTKMKKYYDMN